MQKKDYQKLSECPFCGCDLSLFPECMVIKRVHTYEYIAAERQKGNFIGPDAGYHVVCEKCGATGGQEITPELAAKKWNRRVDNGKV